MLWSVKRALFWNRCGKEVVHVLSVNKCNSAESMKKVVVDELFQENCNGKTIMNTLRTNMDSSLDKDDGVFQVMIGDKHVSIIDAITNDIDKTLLQEASMARLIKLVMEDRIDEVYKNKYLYFLFQHTCVMSVIFKRKWKQKRMIENSCDYVTNSDKAFAFLSLENHGNRYLDMVNINKSKKDYSTPKYTDINGLHKLKGKGWSKRGMMRFVILQEKVETMRREHKHLMRDLGESVKLYYILMYRNKKTTYSGQVMNKKMFKK